MEFGDLKNGLLFFLFLKGEILTWISGKSFTLQKVDMKVKLK